MTCCTYYYCTHSSQIHNASSASLLNSLKWSYSLGSKDEERTQQMFLLASGLGDRHWHSVDLRVGPWNSSSTHGRGPQHSPGTLFYKQLWWLSSCHNRPTSSLQVVHQDSLVDLRTTIMSPPGFWDCLPHLTHTLEIWSPPKFFVSASKPTIQLRTSVSFFFVKVMI